MDGHVVRNGEIVDEPYLARDTVTDCTPVTVVRASSDLRAGRTD